MSFLHRYVRTSAGYSSIRTQMYQVKRLHGKNSGPTRHHRHTFRLVGNSHMPLLLDMKFLRDVGTRTALLTQSKASRTDDSWEWERFHGGQISSLDAAQSDHVALT